MQGNSSLIIKKQDLVHQDYEQIKKKIAMT